MERTGDDIATRRVIAREGPEGQGNRRCGHRASVYVYLTNVYTLQSLLDGGLHLGRHQVAPAQRPRRDWLSAYLPVLGQARATHPLAR